MTIKQRTKDFLQTHVWARERRNKADAVWCILFETELNYINTINKDLFKELWSEMQSIHRWINKHQHDNKELQGTDYKDKDDLQLKKQLELGYAPGYKIDNSKYD